MRFSTVAGEQGPADTAQDPRGLAMKSYTEAANWDLVRNNTPALLVRDPLKFQDSVHSQRRHPGTGRRDPTMKGDFWSLSPESLHQVTILMGERGIPATSRNMNGYSSHTYSLWNEKGERFRVKWHFKTMQRERLIGTIARPWPPHRRRSSCGSALSSRAPTRTTASVWLAPWAPRTPRSARSRTSGERNEPRGEKPPRFDCVVAEPDETRRISRAFLYGTFAVGVIVAALIIYLGSNGYIGTWIPGSP